MPPDAAIAKPSPSQNCPGTSHATFQHNSFEGSGLGTQQAVTLPAPGVTYPPAGSSPVPWTWSGAGIAGSQSVTATTQPPDGSFVLFLQSSSATGVVGFSFLHTLPGPTGRVWRIAFLAAQSTLSTEGGVDHQVVRVTVSAVTANGVVSEVVFDDAIRDQVFRTHLTRPFVASAATITITVEGTVKEMPAQTALLDVLTIREVLPWSSQGTWEQGNVPTTDTLVTIPASASVGIVAGAADSIDLQGELLALEPDQAGGGLSTRSLHVHGPGSWFQVGTEGRPFQGRFQLTLDDDRIGKDEWINALLVSDRGTADLHGRKATSWLRLAQTTGVDGNIVVEAVPQGWAIDDEIVVASSDRNFEHAERRKIAAITPLGNGQAAIDFYQPLQHSHCGVTQPVQGPLGIVTLDQRAEVGLLSHNVKVVGEPRSTMSVPRLGGHIMIRSEHGLLNHPGFGRFSGVELANLGRQKQVGRYPIHWHMLLDGGKGQYMKNCSIRDSNLRVVSVHGTDYVLFENNVAHEHLGHGVFLEDGSEQWNVFRNNLVLGTRRPAADQRVLLSDIEPLDVFQNRAPATFWITNPHNTFVGNVAAGGEGCGFWFALPGQHMGDSAQSPADAYFGARTKPFDQTLLQFDDNRCHSTWLAQ